MFSAGFISLEVLALARIMRGRDRDNPGVSCLVFCFVVDLLVHQFVVLIPSQQIPGTEKEWPAQLVVLAMGFVSPEASISKPLKLELDQVMT